jgi:hypothetical protein
MENPKVSKNVEGIDKSESHLGFMNAEADIVTGSIFVPLCQDNRSLM